MESAFPRLLDAGFTSTMSFEPHMPSIGLRCMLLVTVRQLVSWRDG